jgi:dihydrofolate synthase/folylpolyglutamate synthase
MTDDRWGSVSADQDASGDADADELAQLLAMAGGADDAGSGPGGGALADALSQGVTTGPTDDRPGHEPDDAESLAALRAVEAELDQRWPETRIEPSLERIRALVEVLGDPQRSYPAIHVAGTNGKSSVTRMIDALLTRIGPRTGRYTSPHLQRVTERIAIDGVPISARRYVELYQEIAPFLGIVDRAQGDGPRLSKFEVLTGMAFAAFADAPVDVAVLEVGLGGRWDATNVVHAPVAVVTPIGLDHVDVLGGTVEAIAQEKAGIVHPGALLVSAPQPGPAAAALDRRAAEVGAHVVRAGVDFGVRRRSVAMGGQLLDLEGIAGSYDEVFLPLYGEHQAGNAATALAAVEGFFGALDRGPVDPDVVREAFASVTSPGRLEVVRRSPTVILDAAHNPAGAAALSDALAEAFTFDRLVAVVAVLGDKDAAGVLAALDGSVTSIVATTNSSPRALPAADLADIARDVLGDDRVEVAVRLDDALDAAIAEAEAGALGGAGVLVTGSVVTVGDARHLLVRPHGAA